MKLRIVKGPECPNCGCRQSAFVSRGQRWGQSIDRRCCRHCGKMYAAAVADPGTADAETVKVEEPLGGSVITYRVPVVKCPECSSTDTVVRSTRRPTRHHKCRNCEAAFKSVEHSRGRIRL